jgi:threonine dehydrogenase-like Zn-dependent dehydrogenase
VLTAVAGKERVHVVGTGAVAYVVRHRHAARRDEQGRPDVVVDLTGDPEVIRDAVRTVADLGTVVLAGSAMPPSLDLDTYPDLHVRGLRLVGVPMATAADQPLTAPCAEESPGPPAEVGLGVPVPAGARWYRISA